MVNFRTKPAVPQLTRILPPGTSAAQGNPLPRTPEEFISDAAVTTRQHSDHPCFPWQEPDVETIPARTHTFRLPESLSRKLDYLAAETRISKTKLVIEALNLLVEKHFSHLGVKS